MMKRIAVSLLVLLWTAAVQAEIPRFTPTGGPFGGHVTALATDPSEPSTIFAGTLQGGIFKSTDAGISWRRASRGLPAAGLLWVHDLAIAPTNGDVIYAAVSDFTGVMGPVIYKSSDGGSRSSTAARSTDTSGFSRPRPPTSVIPCG